MHNIYYKSAEGVIINLIEAPYKMLSETELLNNEWETITVGENNPRINKLKKKMVSPPFKIRVSGNTKAEMLNNLERIEGVFDRDCFLFETTKQMGRLYIGDFYRECIITSSTKEKVFEKTGTTVQYVATSNDGFWRNEKEISFSGSGALVGEIADKVYVSASHQSQNIIYTPQADHTCHLEWSANTYGDQWIRFDLGNVTAIGEFSGISLSNVGSTPIQCVAEISSGERVTEYETNTHDTNTPVEDLNRIAVDDFTEVTIENINLDGVRVYLYGYYDDINYTYKEVTVGDTVDVSEFRFFKFYTAYGYSHSCTIAYAMNEEQWTTVETYSGDSTVVLEDIECSSIRLRGSMLGVINDDISVISDEVAPVRNLLNLGYQLENLTVSGDALRGITFRLQDATQYGYVYFDDEDVVLKSISTNNVLGGGCEVQGLLNNEWVKITDITAQMSQTYNTHYDQIRLVKKPKTQSPLTYDYIRINIGVIGVTTDAKVYNDSYAPSNAIIEISEMPNNPSVTIGNTEYGANIELLSGHRLVIDTKNHTVYDYSDDVSYENVYSSRMADSFTKIETGENDVIWGGNAEIKITLEQARSTPKWN